MLVESDEEMLKIVRERIRELHAVAPGSIGDQMNMNCCPAPAADGNTCFAAGPLTGCGTVRERSMVVCVQRSWIRQWDSLPIA